MHQNKYLVTPLVRHAGSTLRLHYPQHLITIIGLTLQHTYLTTMNHAFSLQLLHRQHIHTHAGYIINSIRSCPGACADPEMAVRENRKHLVRMSEQSE